MNYRSRMDKKNVSAFLFSAILLSTPIHLLLLGTLGLSGNSIVTGCYFIVLSVSFCIVGLLRISSFRLTSMDFFCALFFLAIGISTIFNFHMDEMKEYALMGIAGLYYAGGRLINEGDFIFIRKYVLAGAAALVCICIVATLPTLINIWSEALTRPLIFGFPHTATVFSFATACLAIAFIYTEMPLRSVKAISILILILASVAIFVASLVRGTFAALIVTILLILFAKILYREKISQIKRAAVVLLVIIAGIFVAAFVRIDSVYSFAAEAFNSKYAAKQMLGVGLVPLDSRAMVMQQTESGQFVVIKRPPTCTKLTAMNISSEIRKGLLADSLYLVPMSGWFGFGLGSFPGLTCVFGGFHPHNVYLQTIIECGWIAGIALFFLLIIPIFRFIRLFRKSINIEFSFLLSYLVFAGLLGAMYGTIYQAHVLFLFLGGISGFLASRSLEVEVSLK